MQNVPRDQIRRAPYAIRPDIPQAQHSALLDHAIELGGPPGAVMGRTIATQEGHTVEILLGWERLEAFVHHDAFPHATSIPVGIIECTDADAAFYAIEYAALDQRAAGLRTSALLYATAAQHAIDHFSRPEDRWPIQKLANALCIARPTLSNRLRLLKGLRPKTKALLEEELIKPEFAKILMAEPNAQRQETLAKRVTRGMMSTRALYKLVHPEYEPPRTVASLRGVQKHRLGDVGAMERTLSQNFGTATTIALEKGLHKGYVDMQFNSLAELKGLLERLDDTVATQSLIRGSMTLNVDNADQANTLLLELGANSDPELEDRPDNG